MYNTKKKKMKNNKEQPRRCERPYFRTSRLYYCGPYESKVTLKTTRCRYRRWTGTSSAAHSDHEDDDNGIDYQRRGKVDAEELNIIDQHTS